MAVISIQLVTHNCDSTLEACLKSIFSQSYRQYAVFAVDNNSSDNTIKILKKYRVKYYQNSDNAGYARGHNQALSLTQSEVVVLLNPDIKLDGHFLRQVMREFYPQVLEKRVGSASGKLIRVNSFKDKNGVIDGLGLFMRRDRKQGLLSEHKPSFTKKKPFPIFGPDGAAPVYLRKMLDDVAINGEVFDEDFYINKEDIDLCWRAQLLGWRSIAIPTAVAYHIRSFRPGIKNRTRVNITIRKCAVRNRYLMIIKNDQVRLLLQDARYIIWYEIKLFLFLLIWERSSLVGYLEAVKLLPKMLQKRNIIQSRRAISVKKIQQWFV